MSGRLRKPWLLGLLLAAAGAAAYANSFAGVFTFDDLDSILHNRSIRHLGAIGDWIRPPSGGFTVTGRPGLNFTLALNWAWSGDQVWSYHLLNLAGHLAAGLLLFGLIRRTLLRVAGFESEASLLAWIAALLWTLHPLQTESVTYIIQRAEMLMGLCYLGAMYCFLRSAESAAGGRRPAAAGWSVGCWLVCALGMTFKEVMVSAPVIMFFYDRTFLSGSFAAAWRRRRSFWLLLALTWIPLVGEVLNSHSRGGTAGVGVGIGFGEYLWTQGPAILRYCGLTVWPHPLVLDYGVERRWLLHPWSALPANAVVAALAVLAMTGLWRSPRWGFLGFWFFAILAPTSLVPGNRQSVAEHRMYLALAPVLIALVAAGWRWWQTRPIAARWALAAAVAAAGAEGAAVRSRNAEFQSDVGLWRSTVQAAPDNAEAHVGLGGALVLAGQFRAAQAEFSRAVQLDPANAKAESNLGLTCQALRENDAAIQHYRRALEIDSHSPQALSNLGAVLYAEGQWAAAAAEFTAALHYLPTFADAARNLGLAEQMQGHWPAAEAAYRRAIALNPTDPELQFQLGLVLKTENQPEAAVQAFAEAVRLRPNYAEAHANWASALVMEHRVDEALGHFATALALDPNRAEVWENRGVVLTGLGKLTEAAADYRQAIRLQPSLADAWANLGNTELSLKQVPDAVAKLREAVRLAPNDALAHYDCGLALIAAGDAAGATEQYAESVRLNPDLAQPRNNLAMQYAVHGRLAEAESQWTELVRRHPEYLPGHLNLAQLYRQTGRPAEARRELDRAERLRSAPAK